jgi:hypothetical protein
VQWTVTVAKHYLTSATDRRHERERKDVEDTHHFEILSLEKLEKREESSLLVSLL